MEIVMSGIAKAFGTNQVLRDVSTVSYTHLCTNEKIPHTLYYTSYDKCG